MLLVIDGRHKRGCGGSELDADRPLSRVRAVCSALQTLQEPASGLQAAAALYSVEGSSSWRGYTTGWPRCTLSSP